MARRRMVDQVYLYLLRRLAADDWADSRLPSMRELAHECGTSVRPVLPAIHRLAKEGLVAVRPRQPISVQPAAGENARRLLAGLSACPTTKRLAVLSPLADEGWAESLFYRRFLEELIRRAYDKRIDALPVVLPSDNQLRFAENVIRRYDAAFLVAVTPEDLLPLHLLWLRRFPMAIFNRRLPGIELPTVKEDDYGAAWRMADLLAGLGHRNMCLVSSQDRDTMPGPRSQVSGWLDYLEGRGLIDECIMPLAYVDRGRFPMLFDRLLRITPRITAVVVSTPTLVRYIAKGDRFLHLAIPKELSIATLGSARGVAWPDCYPPITFFDLNVERAAECAVEIIVRLLAGEVGPPSIRMPLDIQLTDSIGPAPSD